MPDSKPGPGPDQPTPAPKGALGRPPRAAANTADPQLPAEQPPKVWETGEDLDGGRIPGTRRLYLAGVLAVAVLASTVTAIAILDQTEDKGSQDPQTTSAAQPVIPGFTPAAPTTEPSGKSGLSSPQQDSEDAASKDKDGSDSPEAQQRGSEPIPEPSKPPASSKAPAKPPASSRKSVQAVNYPDRYWHLSSGVIRLDQVSSRSGSETREDSSFKVVSGLAKPSCYSFQMSDGRYVRHQNFRLRVSGNDGSALFRQDATFCPIQSPYSDDAVMLQAVNYPDRFLRHKNFELVLDPYGYNTTGRQDFFFRLVKGLG
ncbi:hypothetical protein GCM10023080_024460 [Streptomyces pseudoechinosporeus]